MLLLIPKANAEKIRIHIDGDLGADYAGFIAADSLGFYESYGIDIEFCKEWGRDECPNDSVLTLAVMNLEKAIEYAGNGGDIVNICQISQTSSLAFISLKNKKIDSLHNLSKMNIAVQRGMYKDTAHLNRLLNIQATIIETHAGMELLVFEGVDAILGSMERDYIDLYFSGYNPEELNVIRLNELGLDIVEEGIYTSQKIYDENKPLLRNFIAATMKGWTYTKNNKKKTAEIMTQYLKQHKMRANVEILDEELEHVINHIFPNDKEHVPFSLDEKDFNTVVDILFRAKLMKQEVKYKDFFKSDILNNEE